MKIVKGVMSDCAPGNYLSMVDNSDVGLSFCRGKYSLTPHSLGEKMGEIRKPLDAATMENKLGVEHPPESSSKSPCNLLQQSWEQKMGEIRRPKNTDSKENELGVDPSPDSPKSLGCLSNGQVSTLTCPPVVSHQEAYGLPDQKSLVKHTTPFKRAKICQPVLKLHRLQGGNFRRNKDLASLGINKESARRLRKQLQNFRRNARRRTMRKNDKSLQNSAKLGVKKIELCSEDFVEDESAKKPALGSPQKPRKKHSRPTANGSITDGVGNGKPAKMAHEPQFDAQSPPSSAILRAHPALNLPRPTVLPFQSQAAAVPPSLMTMPWLSPPPSLFNHSLYAPCPPATPVVLPPRDTLMSSLKKSPPGPAMIPLDRMQAPVLKKTHSGKISVPIIETQPGKLASTASVALNPEESSTSVATDQGRLPVVSQPGMMPALSDNIPKHGNSPSPTSVTRYPSFVAQPGNVSSPFKVPHSEKMSIPSSVACRPPPLIPLPLSRENVDIHNIKTVSPYISNDLVSSKMMPGQSQKGIIVSELTKTASQIKTTFHSSATLPHEASARREADTTLIQNKYDGSRTDSTSSQNTPKTSHLPSVSSHLSSTVPQAVTTTSQDSLILSVPKILPKVSASPAGLAISPMVLIPATVAFEALSSQVATRTSHATAKGPHVRTVVQASIPVSSVTPGIPPQYYWIVTPKLSTPSTTASVPSPVDSSQKLVTYHSLPKTPTLSASVSSSKHSIIAPPPVSSSSYLASLLKAGVPLVPVASTPSSGPRTSSVFSDVSRTPLPISISVPAPIMSTPPIIARPKNLSLHDSGEEYRLSYSGPKSAEKQGVLIPMTSAAAAATSPPNFNSLPPDPASVPSTYAQAVVSAAHGSSSKRSQAVKNIMAVSSPPTFHIPENDTTNEDTVRINAIISAVLGNTSARLSVEPVSSDHEKRAKSTPKSQRRVYKKRDNSREPLSGDSKLKAKKHVPRKRKTCNKTKLQGENSSSVLSQPTPSIKIQEEAQGKDFKTHRDNVEDEKCLEKELSTSSVPVTSRSVIISTNMWKNESNGASSSRGSKLAENFSIETLAKSAKVDFVPVISHGEQQHFYAPQLAGTETAAEDDKAEGRRQTESTAEKQVRGDYVPGSDGVLKRTSTPKTAKKKRTNLEGIKVPCKRKHQSSKTPGTTKKISDVVESLTKEKERCDSVLRNVDLNNGSGVVRSSIICRVESSHGKNSVISPSAVPTTESSYSRISAISSPALAGKPSHSTSTTNSSCSALAAESSFRKNIVNTPLVAQVRESAPSDNSLNPLLTSLAPVAGETSSTSVATNNLRELSWTRPNPMKNSKRACWKRLLVKVERLTHRQIEKNFLKEHGISMRSGTLLRQKLRNFDIKRHFLLHGKRRPLLTSESSSRPTPKPAANVERKYKIITDGQKSAFKQMVHKPHVRNESNFWPPPADILVPSTSKPIWPQKPKHRIMPPPRLTFMGEHAEASSNKGPSQSVQNVCDRMSDGGSPGIITCKRKQLLVLKNERLSQGQVNFLSLIGLSLAKRVSNNSDLDSLEGSQIMMDPGLFGLEGTSRPPPSWSLVLDAQGSEIENNANLIPTSSQGHTSREVGGIQGQSQLNKTAALSASQMYAPASLPPGHVYTTAFMAPGQQVQNGQGQYILAPIANVQDANAQGLASSVIHQRRIYAPTVTPPKHQPSSVGLPSTAVVQAPHSAVGTRIFTVDHAGRFRETLSQGLPTAYGRYSATASRPDSWNNQRPSTRASPPPPLTFMGTGGMSSSMRDTIQVTKAPRGMPPPLSFMGSSSETSARPVNLVNSSQSSPRPSNAGVWARALDLSQQGSASQSYGVINHTRHIAPEKLPPNLPYTAHGNVGLDPRPSGLPCGAQIHAIDHHQPNIPNAMQAHVIPNQRSFKLSHTNQAQAMHDRRQSSLPYSPRGKSLNHRMASTPQEAHEHPTGNQQQPSLPQNVLRQGDVRQRPSSLPQDGQATLNKQPLSLPLNAHGQVELNQRPSSVPHNVQGVAPPNQHLPELPYSTQSQVVIDHHLPRIPSSVQVSITSSLQTPASSRGGTPDSSYNCSPGDLGTTAQYVKISHELDQHHHHKSHDGGPSWKR